MGADGREHQGQIHSPNWENDLYIQSLPGKHPEQWQALLRGACVPVWTWGSGQYWMASHNTVRLNVLWECKCLFCPHSIQNSVTRPHLTSKEIRKYICCVLRKKRKWLESILTGFARGILQVLPGLSTKHLFKLVLCLLQPPWPSCIKLKLFKVSNFKIKTLNFKLKFQTLK